MSSSHDQLPYRPCAGIMVLNRQDLVFVGKRADGPGDPEGRGRWWQMPQGGIDEGEDARAAALRELYEETNMRSVEIIAEAADWVRYDLPPHLLGKAWKGRYRGQQQKWFAMRFTGEESEIDILNPGGGHKPEFVEWRWAPMNQLMDLVVPFKLDAYRQVIAAFEHLAGA